MTRLDFKLEATASGSRARAARFTTRHNEVLTPTFMPVGTQASVKALSPEAKEKVAFEDVVRYEGMLQAVAAPRPLVSPPSNP